MLNRYKSAPAPVQKYFIHLPMLLADFPLDVSLSYLFSQVELAQNMTLYCGIVKRHRAERSLVRTAIDTHRMTRSDFTEKFAIVFGKQIPAPISDVLHEAEAIRDRVMHGKSTEEKDKRKALVNVIEYAQGLNDFIATLVAFRPFGELRGFKGRAKSLDKSTTRWVLKGMGFGIS